MRPLINFLRRVKHYTCGSTGDKDKLIKPIMVNLGIKQCSLLSPAFLSRSFSLLPKVFYPDLPYYSCLIAWNFA